MSDRGCRVEHCDREHHARGWCRRHYNRWYNAVSAGREPLTPVERFLAKIDKSSDDENGCWLWTGAVHPTGYGMLHWDSDIPQYAHRVSWEIAHGREIPDGAQICHHCDTPACVRPSHLFLGDAALNAADMKAKDRSARGERSGHAVLTAEQVIDIRRRCAAGELQRDLAEEFGVATNTVSQIINRVTWAHLPDPQEVNA